MEDDLNEKQPHKGCVIWLVKQPQRNTELTEKASRSILQNILWNKDWVRNKAAIFPNPTVDIEAHE